LKFFTKYFQTIKFPKKKFRRKPIDSKNAHGFQKTISCVIIVAKQSHFLPSLLIFWIAHGHFPQMSSFSNIHRHPSAIRHAQGQFGHLCPPNCPHICPVWLLISLISPFRPINWLLEMWKKF
jgi:hypothetical protein